MGKCRYKRPVDYRLSESFSFKKQNLLHGNSKKQKDSHFNLIRSRVVCPGDFQSEHPLSHINALPSKIAMSVVVKRKSRFQPTSLTSQHSCINDRMHLSKSDSNTNIIQFQSQTSVDCSTSNTSPCLCENNSRCKMNFFYSEERQKSSENSEILAVQDNDDSALHYSHSLNDWSSRDENRKKETSKFKSSPCMDVNLTEDGTLVQNSKHCLDIIDNNNHHLNSSFQYCCGDKILTLRNLNVNNVVDGDQQNAMHVTSIKNKIKLYSKHMTTEDFLCTRKSSISERSFDSNSTSSLFSDSKSSDCYKPTCRQEFVLDISKEPFHDDVRMKMSALELLSYSADSLLENSSSDYQSIVNSSYQLQETLSHSCDFDVVEDANSNNNNIENLETDCNLEEGGEGYGDESSGVDGNNDIYEKHLSSGKNSTDGCYSSFSHEDDLAKRDTSGMWNSDDDINDEE